MKKAVQRTISEEKSYCDVCDKETKVTCQVCGKDVCNQHSVTFTLPNYHESRRDGPISPIVAGFATDRLLVDMCSNCLEERNTLESFMRRLCGRSLFKHGRLVIFNPV